MNESRDEIDGNRLMRLLIELYTSEDAVWCEGGQLEWNVTQEKNKILNSD